MSGTADPLSPEFDVVVDGDTYTFRKPTIRYRIELGYKAADVRQRAYPQASGALHFGVDYEVVSTARAFAILELYLVRSSVPPERQWVFSPGVDGKPVVDFDKFPPDREGTALELAAKFEEEVARFRKGRNTDKPPAGGEAVGGQPNPG